MRTEGSLSVKAHVDRLWASLWDSDTLPAWIPGCTRAEWKDAGHVEAEVEQTLALLKARFYFSLTVDERNEELRRARFRGTGTCPNLSSKVELDMALSLTPAENGPGTNVRYDTEWTLTGRLAAIGQFIMNAKMRELQRALCASLERQLAAHR